MAVQIPSRAVSDRDDVLGPANELLQGLNLLGTKEELDDADKATALFGGPPQSVALIEAGATALSKWWATGLGASVAAMWATVAVWFGDLPAANQHVVLGGTAVVTAATVLAIGYILGSDVRGRSVAAAATIEARAKLGDALIRAAQLAYRPAPAPSVTHLVALPGPLRVMHTTKAREDEDGWYAVALLSDHGTSTKFLVSKGSAHEWVDASSIELADPPTSALSSAEE